MSPRAACRLEALGYEAFDYVGGIADWTAAGLPTVGAAERRERIIDATRSDVPICNLADGVAQIRAVMVNSGWDVCVVLDCDGLVVGRIRKNALAATDASRVADVMEPGPSTVRPDQPLRPLVIRMHRRRTSSVFVTTPQGQLVGILMRDDADHLLAEEPH